MTPDTLTPVLPEGYTCGADKVDRRVDPYLAWVRNPNGYTYTGLFATEGKANSWIRKIAASDRFDPRQPLPPPKEV